MSNLLGKWGLSSCFGTDIHILFVGVYVSILDGSPCRRACVGYVLSSCVGPLSHWGLRSIYSAFFGKLQEALLIGGSVVWFLLVVIVTKMSEVSP